jgi:gamma-glutamylcyclotransferase (GGCT)/AIG2-like uncharacterized protein YtfP
MKDDTQVHISMDNTLIVTVPLGNIIPRLDPKKLVFVYGTLMRGFFNCRRLLTNSIFICEAKVLGYKMYDCNGSFPCAFPTYVDKSSVTEFIVGEVWAVTEDVLKSLDRLEGIDAGFYKRQLTTCIVGIDNMCSAIIYYRDDPTVPELKQVTSGNWKEYINKELINVELNGGELRDVRKKKKKGNSNNNQEV